jgi:hypothetical protein
MEVLAMHTKVIGPFAIVLSSLVGCSPTAEEPTAAPASEDEVITAPKESTKSTQKFFYVIKRDGLLTVHELNTETMECADGGMAYECPLVSTKPIVNIDRDVVSTNGSVVNAKNELLGGKAIARGTLAKKNVSGTPPAFELTVDQVWIAQDVLGTDAPFTWATLSTICGLRPGDECGLPIKSASVNIGREEEINGVRWGAHVVSPLKERLERALKSSEVLVYGGVRAETKQFHVVSVYLKLEDAKP